MEGKAIVREKGDDGWVECLDKYSRSSCISCFPSMLSKNKPVLEV